MESLFDTLYSYAMEHRFEACALRDTAERQENETMIRRAMDELRAHGMDDAAERIRDGYCVLRCLDGQAAFRAGLSIGTELSRL